MYESYDRVRGALGSQKNPKRQQSKSTPFDSHDHCLFHLNNHGRGILTKAPWSDDVTVHVLMPSSNGNIQITMKWQVSSSPHCCCFSAFPMLTAPPFPSIIMEMHLQSASRLLKRSIQSTRACKLSRLVTSSLCNQKCVYINLSNIM